MKFKTLRHIETVRNYINGCIVELLNRAELHDQTKLQSPESEIFEECTNQLRGLTYGTAEYTAQLKKMKPALDHHYSHNRHHPEFHLLGGGGNEAGVEQSPLERMNLIDLLEMMCDWKAATLRHADGDIAKSIEINQKRFGYSDEVKQILENTAQFIDAMGVRHHAEES